MKARTWTTRVWMVGGVVLVSALAAGVFTLGSLDVPVRPEKSNAFLVLFALSTFMFAALFVFGLILVRSLIRLGLERRAGKLGSRFKTKMVMGAMAVSLLPVLGMF
ncbi:MAG: hypothetical protein ACRD4K_13085, partial [Candidatus Acidiferrales bacterium]